MRRATPKVRKNPGGTKNSKWVVDGLRIEGKRVRKFFPSEAKAKSWMNRKVAQLKREGEAGLAIPQELRVEAVKCAAMLKPYGCTLTEAVSFYVGRLEAIQRSCTVDELIASMLTAKEKDGKKDRSLKDLRNRLTRFSPLFGNRSVVEITTAEIDDWLRSLPVGPQTRNNYRSVVRTLFSYAVDRGYLDRSPVTRSVKVKVPKGAKTIFTPAQMRSLLDAANDTFLPFLAIGGFAGLRSEEIYRLDWADVDLRSLKIKVSEDSKTAAARFVKITSNLAEWLAPHAKDSGPVATENTLRTARTKAWKAAGMMSWKGNALRHSFGSYHYALHDDAAGTAAQLGHSTTKMLFEHYRDLVTPEAAKEWFALAPS